VVHLEMDDRCKASRATLEDLVRRRYPDVKQDYEELRKRQPEQVKG